MSRAKLKPDYSRKSFVEVKAPQQQQCDCGCGEYIYRNQICFGKPFVVRGKQKGTTRIVNMDHYDNWIESISGSYVKTIVDRHPEAKEYFER